MTRIIIVDYDQNNLSKNQYFILEQQWYIN